MCVFLYVGMFCMSVFEVLSVKVVVWLLTNMNDIF
jgi:hypothetical protein